MPPWRVVRAVSERHGTEDLGWILSEVARLLAEDPLPVPADLDDCLAVARLVSGSRLSLRERFRYVGVPIDRRHDIAVWELERWARAHGNGERPAPPSRKGHDVPGDATALHACEDMVKRMTTYLWLSERWPETYVDADAVKAERQKVNALIERALASKALARRCGQCQRKLPPTHRFPICDPCHRSRYRRHDHDDEDDDYY